MTTQAVLGRIATTNLLPSDMAAAILNGETPNLEEIVTVLITGVQDAEAMSSADAETSWGERRIARQVLTLAFLLVIAGNRQCRSGSDCGTTAGETG